MKIVVNDANLAPHRERFEAAVNGQVRWYAGGVPLEELRDADVYVGSRFTADMAEAAEKLRLIHVAGAGTDKVDFEALASGVLVANTFHHERSIAEYVVAAAVMLRRDFLTQDRASAAGCGRHRCTTLQYRSLARCVTRTSDSSASGISVAVRGTCSAPSVVVGRR